MSKTTGVVRGLVVNDLHTSDQPPLGRLPTYRDDIAAKLRECAEITRAEKLDLTIFTADFFHQKRQNLVSHGLVQENADILCSFHGDRKGILGSHDLSFEGVASMSTQPIGTLAKTGAVDILLEDVIIKYNGLAVLLSPVVWTPDIDRDPDNFRLGPESLLLAKDADFVIRIAHGSIVPPGWGDTPFDVVLADQIDLTGIDLLLSGHLHPDYGVFDIHQGKHVCHFANLGALSRVSRSPDQLARETIRVLGFTIVGPHQAEYAEYELSTVRPVADVFYQMAEADEPLMELEDYAQRLAEFVVEEDDIERLLRDAERSGVPPEVMRIVLMRLEEVGYVPSGYSNAAEAASGESEGDPD